MAEKLAAVVSNRRCDTDCNVVSVWLLQQKAWTTAQRNVHNRQSQEQSKNIYGCCKCNVRTMGIQQLENTNKSLEIVTAQNKKQDDRLTALEKAPGVFGNKLWWAVIAAFVSGFVAYELAAFLH